MKPSPPIVTRAPSATAVWAPWLAAPLFALLPISGCGLASLPATTASTPQGSASAAVPVGTVVTIIPGADRQVAWLPAAD